MVGTGDAAVSGVDVSVVRSEVAVGANKPYSVCMAGRSTSVEYLDAGGDVGAYEYTGGKSDDVA